MEHVILIPSYVGTVKLTMTINEDHSIVDIESSEPEFFNFNLGKRQTYTMYRGCLIVRYTIKIHNSDRVTFRNERCTVAYLFGADVLSYFIFFDGGWPINSIREAKKTIDKIIEQGWYSYGLKQKP